MADTEDTIEKSHVYVVEGALNVCKIGKTIDIRARISALQTGHPIKLTKLAFLRKCMMCRPPEYRTEVDASIADDNWNYRRRWKGP